MFTLPTRTFIRLFCGATTVNILFFGKAVRVFKNFVVGPLACILARAVF